MSGKGGHNSDDISAIPREWNAFCRFIEAHYGVIYTVALSHVRDAEIAQEVSQDICVRLLLEREKLPPMTNAKGWLVRVSRNTAIDWVRRRQTHSRIIAMMESLNHNPTAGNHRTEDARNAAIKVEENERLYAALETIAPDDRELILMHFMNGLDKQEIARLLELHPSTVGRRIDRGIAALRKSMKDFDGAKLRELRPAQHSAQSVLATLTAVAALSASQQAALAAVAAPLPVLSATAAASTVGAAAGHAIGGGASGLSNALSGWALPAITGLAIFAGVIIYADKVPFLNFDTSTRSPAETTAIDVRSSRDSSKLKAQSAPLMKLRRPAAGQSQMKGLTSVGATSLGYLYPSTDGKTIEGTVINENREPIVGAKVTFHTANPDGSTTQTVSTSAAGNFVFTNLPADMHPGTVQTAWITATADGYAHATEGEYSLLLPLPEVSLDMQIVLSRPVTMQGTIVNEAGEPVPNAELSVISEFDRFKQAYQDKTSDDNHIFKTFSGPDGRFKFDQLKPGYASLIVSHPNYATEPTLAFPSDDKDVRVVLNKGVTITGTVHDGLTTLTGIPVRIMGQFKGPGTPDLISVKTDQNGRFVAEKVPVPGIDIESPRLPVAQRELRSWSYTIHALSEGETTFPRSRVPRYSLTLYHGQTTRTIHMNTNDPRAGSWNLKNVHLPDDLENAQSLTGGATLHGTVSLPDGLSTSADVAVIIKGAGQFKSTYYTRDGQFEARHLHAGDYTIIGYSRYETAPGYEVTTLFGPVTISLREGETHTAQLQPGSGGMRIHISGNKPGERLNAQFKTLDPLSPWYNNTPFGTSFNNNETAEFRGLQPGNYHAAAVVGDKRVQYVPVKIPDGQIVDCEIRIHEPLKVTGSVINSATGKPPEGAEVKFALPGYVTNNSVSFDIDATVDAKGQYQAELTTGTYTISVAPRNNKGNRRSLQFDVDAAHTQIPDIDISAPTGGIRFSRMGDAVDDLGWRQAQVDLFSVGQDSQQTLNCWLSVIDNNTAVMQNIPMGTYNALVRCEPYGGDMDKPFASVFVPNIKVRPDFFNIIALNLEPGISTMLRCEPSAAQITSFTAPEFWLKDSSGVATPVKLSDELEFPLALAPGAYTFGATLGAGQQQTIDFTVGSEDTQKEIVLRLR